jgi:hypothetical protein
VSTDYGQWKAQADKLRAEGNVEAYITWATENPSPITTRHSPEQYLRTALSNAAHGFRGASVRVTFGDGGYVYEVTGKIAGLGFIHDGGTSRDAMVLEGAGGAFSAVRIDQIASVEGHHSPEEAKR